MQLKKSRVQMTRPFKGSSKEFGATAVAAEWQQRQQASKQAIYIHAQVSFDQRAYVVTANETPRPP